jgi:hypothetical protein
MLVCLPLERSFEGFKLFNLSLDGTVGSLRFQMTVEDEIHSRPDSREANQVREAFSRHSGKVNLDALLKVELAQNIGRVS